MPIFDVPKDAQAIAATQQIFSKKIVPLNINDIAQKGGLLNCISWEN